MTDARRARIRRVVYSRDTLHPLHSHEETQLTILLGGSIDEYGGERDMESVHTLRPLMVVAKPAGLLHANCFRNDTVTLQLRFSAHVASSYGIRHWRTYTSGPLIRWMLSLLERLPAGHDTTAFPRVLAEKIFSGGAETQTYGRRGISPPAWLSECRRIIDRDFRQRVMVQDLAQRVGVHRVSLHRGFRRHFGSTIEQYVKGLRLAYAANLLCQPSISVVDIALQSGFFDQSHLNRVFRSHTGLTPRQYRIRALA